MGRRFEPILYSAVLLVNYEVFLSLEIRHGKSRPGFVAFVAPPAPRVAPTFPKGPGEKKTTHSAVSARHWAAAIFRVSRSRRHGCFQIKLAQHSTLGLRLVGNQRKKGLQTRFSFAVLLFVHQESDWLCPYVMMQNMPSVWLLRGRRTSEKRRVSKSRPLCGLGLLSHLIPHNSRAHCTHTGHCSEGCRLRYEQSWARFLLLGDSRR